MNAKWSVLAVYQDATARQTAVSFCDALVQRFWPETGFDLDWQEWENLRDPAAAQHATTRAKEAKIIIISTSMTATIDPFVENWLEFALSKRREREGILVGLSPQGDLPQSARAAATQQYLRKLAHQHGLDYLASVPQSLSPRVPETIEACTLRATQVSSVLDTILHRPPVPPRLL